MKYWYELINRPISFNTQPKGFIELDREHINRKGYPFGKIAYAAPLTEKEVHDYELEPVHLPGCVEVSLIDQATLSGNGIRMTVAILQHLLGNGLLPLQEVPGSPWQYVNPEELKQYADEHFQELKELYKTLRKAS